MALFGGNLLSGVNNLLNTTLQNSGGISNIIGSTLSGATNLLSGALNSTSVTGLASNPALVGGISSALGIPSTGSFGNILGGVFGGGGATTTPIQGTGIPTPTGENKAWTWIKSNKVVIGIAVGVSAIIGVCIWAFGGGKSSNSNRY